MHTFPAPKNHYTPQTREQLAALVSGKEQAARRMGREVTVGREHLQVFTFTPDGGWYGRSGTPFTLDRLLDDLLLQEAHSQTWGARWDK